MNLNVLFYILPRKAGSVLIAALLCFAVILVVCTFASHAVYTEGNPVMSARLAVLQTLGMSYLRLASEGTGFRDLTEGAYSCLGDVPGGYCYLQSCDIISFPRALQTSSFRMRVIKNGADAAASGQKREAL